VIPFLAVPVASVYLIAHSLHVLEGRPLSAVVVRPPLPALLAVTSRLLKLGVLFVLFCRTVSYFSFQLADTGTLV